MDISTITGIIAGIAAQGAVTVTIPEDSEITREFGQIEMTRQIGPIELRIKTAKGKNTTQTAPVVKTDKSAPAEKELQAAPAETETQAPEVAAKQVAPAEVESQAAPEKVDTEAAPEKVETEAAPEQVETEAAPEQGKTEAAPTKTEDQPAPVKVARQVPVAVTPSQETEAQETGYEGLWYDHTGRSAIKITNCGEGLCGRIAWLKNSDHKSVCGTDIIGGVKKVGNIYDNGWIYDIDRGRKFDVELKLLNENKLRVKGYAGTKFLSKTFLWNRAPGNLELCS